MDMKPEGGKKVIWKADKDFSLIGDDTDYVRLDLACGNAKRPGFVGVDISKESQADIILDLESPLSCWRWKESSVNEISCSHFVEHVKDLKWFMIKLWYILVPGGTIQINAPYWTHLGAHQDFSHVRCINEITFQYFCQPSLKAMGIGHYNVKCDFDVTMTRFVFEPEWVDRSEEAKEWARKHYNNVVREIEVYLKAVKPIRK